MDDRERDDLVRRFWATFLGSTVDANGDVPGFQAWQQQHDSWERDEADRYCHWAWRKIDRDRRDPDECIASGVRALKEQLSLYRPAQERPSVQEVAQIIKVIKDHMEPPWNPAVAQP